MSDTGRLKLPRIDAAQSQKHVTHNEALDMIDALVHLSVAARNVVAPPASPADGTMLLLGSAPQDVFSGYGKAIAVFLDNAWRFHVPKKGWRAYVEPGGLLYIFDGTDWVTLRTDLQDVQNIRFAGFGTTANAQNPLSARLNTALFAARPVSEAGTGDLRINLNREQATNTVSQIYQSNWSGRAETGLMGDDKFRIKVSANGTSWRDALYADPATGRVFFPNGASDLAAAAVLTSGTPAAYTLSAPMRGPLPEGATFWMVPHVPNATALNTDPTLQIDQIDAAPVPLRNFDGSMLAQGALETNKVLLVRKTGATYCVQLPRLQPAFQNLVEDGGRFASNPEPASWKIVGFADVTWITNLNGTPNRANFGLIKPSATVNPAIADLLNKIRTPAQQVDGPECFAEQVTAGAGVTGPVTVQGTNFYPVFQTIRNVGRGVTGSIYFRVMSGSLIFADTDTTRRVLIDGVGHDFTLDQSARIFTAAHGWKHAQWWVTPPNGTTANFWPLRVTPGTVFLIAMPAVVAGLETIPWDIGQMPSARHWR